MRRDYLTDKYIILLNKIIADYDKNKSEKGDVKINLIIYFI